MEYTLTKKDVEKLLGKSGKTVSRYIKSGKLTPIKKKVDGYITYLFSLNDIEDFKRGQSGHDGQDATRQGTNEETFRTTEQDRNTDRVNKLHGGTEETNGETKQGKKDRPEDIRDRTRDTETLDILKDTIAILKEQLDQKDKQITNITNTMQFALKEASEYRQMLALPNPTSESKQGLTGDIIEETEDRTPVKERTIDRTKRGTRGKTKAVSKKKTKPVDKGQSEGQKKDKPKKRGLFNWIFKR